MARAAGLRWADRTLRVLPAVALFGMVVLALTLVLGFEQPNTALFLLSALLVLAAPSGVLLHLAFNAGLTREEKRTWARALASVHSARALTAYVDGNDRRGTLSRLQQREEQNDRIDDV